MQPSTGLTTHTATRQLEPAPPVRADNGATTRGMVPARAFDLELARRNILRIAESGNDEALCV